MQFWINFKFDPGHSNIIQSDCSKKQAGNWQAEDPQFESRSRHFALFFLSYFCQAAELAQNSNTLGGKISNAEPVLH